VLVLLVVLTVGVLMGCGFGCHYCADE
jgi:hypothetical protein